MKNITIGFHTPDLNLRGTNTALFDYAYHHQIRGNKSIILVQHQTACPVQKKFELYFKVIFYQDLEATIFRERIQILYAIKYGKNDGIFSSKIPTIIHCVFDMSEKHGDLYLGVSPQICQKFNSKLCLPHMISDRWLISPEKHDKIVIGRIGAKDIDEFDFVYPIINELEKERPDIHFIFANSREVYNGKNLTYIDSIIDDDQKRNFIQSCDVYLECGKLGHSFGLAIGEFSINNKPIISYDGPNIWNNAHNIILGKSAIYYQDKESLKHIFMTITKHEIEIYNWRAYENFTPEKVMKIFYDHLAEYV